MRRGGVLGPASFGMSPSAGMLADEAPAGDEVEADDACDGVLLRDAAPSKAGWRYPSNHALKHES